MRGAPTRSGVLDFNFVQLKADIGHILCCNFAVYANILTYDAPIDPAWGLVLGMLMITKISWCLTELRKSEDYIEWTLTISNSEEHRSVYVGRQFFPIGYVMPHI
jgi:hypothetical protein